MEAPPPAAAIQWSDAAYFTAESPKAPSILPYGRHGRDVAQLGRRFHHRVQVQGRIALTSVGNVCMNK